MIITNTIEDLIKMLSIINKIQPKKNAKEETSVEQTSR